MPHLKRRLGRHLLRPIFLGYIALLPPLQQTGIFRWRFLRKLARSIYLRLRYGRAARITVRGERWWVPVHDKYFTPALLIQGSYEPVETPLVQRLVQPGMAVLDIGAHAGYYTCLAAQLVGPTGRVYALEPLPFNRRLLRRNVAQRGYHWVTVVPTAASDEAGEHVLYLNPMNSGDNRLAPPDQVGSQVTIRTARADDLVPTGTRIDFVKMDVQGWELRALRGMRRILAANPQVIILMEIWPRGLERAGASAEAVVRLCEDYGLALHLFDVKQPGAVVRVELADLLATIGRDRDAVNAVFAPQTKTGAGLNSTA